MLWKDFFINLVNLSVKDLQNRGYSIHITNVDWRTLVTRDSQKNKDWYHWVRLSPTFAKTRRITIEWLIRWETRGKLNDGMNYLDKVFALQNEPNGLEQRLFTIIDENWKSWDIKTKIKTPIQYKISEDDYLDADDRDWRVVLEAEDPRLFSSVKKISEGSEWVYWGFKLWIKAPTKQNLRFNKILCENTWNHESPCIVEIKTKPWKKINSPLTIKNLSNNTYFKLDLNTEENEVIKIDSYNFKVTKNETEDILYKRLPWSIFPNVKWKTYFSIEDNDWGLYDNDFEIKIYYNNVLL